jgi:Tfp pilus assembly protein FimT
MKNNSIKNKNLRVRGFTPTPDLKRRGLSDKFLNNSIFSLKNKNTNQVWGFTIVELAVSMLIIGLISTIVLANYNTGRRQEALNRSAQRLAVAIRQAQNYALFSRVGTKCSTPTGGYGVYILSASQYIIFGDCNGNHVYNSVADDLISTVSVEQSVVIKSDQQPTVIGASMTFEPPIGKFYYNGSPPTVPKTITLRDPANDKQKTITLSLNGSVSVQ